MSDPTCNDKICAAYVYDPVSGTSCMQVQLKGATTPIEIETACLQDDNGPFIRTYTIDAATGDILSFLDTDLAGVDYTVVGTVTKPSDEFDIETLLFCDDNNVQFLKTIVYNADGTIGSVIDTDLAGAAFSPALPIKPLGGEDIEVTSIVLCDSGNNNKPYLMVSYHNTVTQTSSHFNFELDGSTAYTPTTPDMVKPEEDFEAIEICVVNQDTATVAGSVAFAGSVATVTDGFVPHPLDPLNGSFIDWGDGTTSPLYSTSHDYAGCPEGEYSIIVEYQTVSGSCFRWRRLVQWDGSAITSIDPNAGPSRTVTYDIWARKVHKHVLCDGTVKGIYNRLGVADTLGTNEVYRFKCPEPYVEKSLGSSTRPIKADAKPYSVQSRCVVVNDDTVLNGSYAFAGAVLTLTDTSVPHPNLSGPNVKIIDWGVGRCSNYGHGFNSFDFTGYPAGDYLVAIKWSYFETGECFRYSRTVSFDGVNITAINGSATVNRTVNHNIKVRDVIRHYDCDANVKGTYDLDGVLDVLAAGESYVSPDDCKPVIEPFKSSQSVQKSGEKAQSQIVGSERIGAGAINLGLTVPASANGAIIQFQLRDPTGDAGACARYHINGTTPSASAGYLAQHKEFLYIGCAASNGATITDAQAELDNFLFNQGEATSGYFIEVTYYAY